MIYTLDEGINDKHERIESYLLRGLPIIVASLIAVFGAFSQADRNQTDANNQEPLAIYTAPPTDLGNPTNPQGNGDNGDQSNSAPGTTPAMDPSSASIPQEESKLVKSSSNGSGGSSGSVAPSIQQPSLPVGGSGGDEGDSCLCEDITNVQPPTVDPGIVNTIPNPPPLPSTDGVL